MVSSGGGLIGVVVVLTLDGGTVSLLSEMNMVETSRKKITVANMSMIGTMFSSPNSRLRGRSKRSPAPPWLSIGLGPLGLLHPGDDLVTHVLGVPDDRVRFGAADRVHDHGRDADHQS